MLFDTLCGAVERHLPEYRDLVEKSRLFVFEGAPHKFLKERPGYHPEFDQELFHLPFPVVAVEDAGSLVILADEVEGAVGLDKPRFFIDVQSINPNVDDLEHLVNFSEAGREFQTAMIAKYPKAIGVNVGRLVNMSLDSALSRFSGTYEAIRSLVVDKKSGIILDDPGSPSLAAGMAPAARNSQVALEELSMLSRKTDFVLEHSSAKGMKFKKGGIARSHQRPNYTILHPDEIRKIMKLDRPKEVTGKTKKAHERRQHLRRYVPGPGKPWKDEQIKVIPACWIGPSESTVQGKKYVVRLDI